MKFKNSPIGEFLLLDADLGAESGFARKAGLFYLREGDDAVFGCVNSVVTAEEGAWAGDFRAASLTHYDFAGVDHLAAKALNTEALPGIISVVLA
jgi:hypothetical protein